MKRTWALRMLGNLAWAVLAAWSLVTLVLVLIPFYMTAGNVPSMGPGYMPTLPNEFATIATYRGTLWESNTFLQDAFWNVGYIGCCSWVPLLGLLLTRRGSGGRHSHGGRSKCG